MGRGAPGLFLLAWAAAWVYRTAPDHAPLAGVFEHWDAVHYRTIAQYGYFSPHSLANDVAFFPGYPLTLAAFQLELVAVGAIVLATLGFRWRSCWPETTYCGLAGLALGTQTWYQSCPRTLLVLFPIWIARSARLGVGPPVRYIYLAVSASLAAVVGLLFLTYQLTG